MATILTIPGSRTEPAEYANTAPIFCRTCGAEFDEEDEGDQIDMVDGEYYCTEEPARGPSCLTLARMAGYRAEVSDAVLRKLQEAMQEISDYEHIYRGVEVDDEDDPYGVIEDAIARVKLYASKVDA